LYSGPYSRSIFSPNFLSDQLMQLYLFFKITGNIIE
jgi:hypothetical protein